MELAQKVETRSKHTLFYWMLAIMLGMIFARNVLHIGFSIYVFLIPIALIAIFGKKDDIIAISIACIPLSVAFQYKYALFICIIAYCIRFARDVKITGKVIPIVIMFFWEMLHVVMGTFSWFELLRSFAELMFLAFMFCVANEEFDMSIICRTLSFSTVFICICILLVQLEANSYDFSEVFSGEFRFAAADKTIENFGLNFNANILGRVCNLAIIGTLLVGDAGKMRFFDITSIGLLAIFGTMTMSRTFIICFVIILVYYFAFQTGGFDKKVARVIGIIVIAVISYILLRIIAPQVIDNFVARFTEEDITNGRDGLFAFYNKHIFSSPIYMFFGIGLQNFQEKIIELYSITINVCHNSYQELIVVWGLPGLGLFLSLIYSVVVKNPEKPIERNVLQYGPLIFLLIAALTGQFITCGENLLGLAFAYICLNNKVSGTRNLLWKEKR